MNLVALVKMEEEKKPKILIWAVLLNRLGYSCHGYSLSTMPTIQSLNFRLGDGGATLRVLNNNMNCLNKVRETDHGYGLDLQKIRLRTTTGVQYSTGSQ